MLINNFNPGKGFSLNDRPEHSINHELIKYAEQMKELKDREIAMLKASSHQKSSFFSASTKQVKQSSSSNLAKQILDRLGNQNKQEI